MKSYISRNVLSNQAYTVLRSAILSGQLVAGSQLVVRALSEELDLSPTPIKSALTALEKEGLVKSVPYRGFFVPQLDSEDIFEIYSLREVLEGLAARLAAQKATDELEIHLKSFLKKQQEAFASNDLEAYGDIDLGFHKSIWQASEHKRLIQTAESIHGQVRLLIVDSAITTARQEEVLAEHKAIFQAIIQRDPEAAEYCARRHIRNIYKSLQNV